MTPEKNTMTTKEKKLGDGVDVSCAEVGSKPDIQQEVAKILPIPNTTSSMPIVVQVIDRILLAADGRCWLMSFIDFAPLISREKATRM